MKTYVSMYICVHICIYTTQTPILSKTGLSRTLFFKLKFSCYIIDISIKEPEFPGENTC